MSPGRDDWPFSLVSLLSVAFLHQEHIIIVPSYATIIHLAISCWRVAMLRPEHGSRSKGLLAAEIITIRPRILPSSISVKMVLMSLTDAGRPSVPLCLRPQTGRLGEILARADQRTDHFNTIQHRRGMSRLIDSGGRPTATTRPLLVQHQPPS